MSKKELAEKLLVTLKEKMWYREGLPSDGWVVEKILEAFDALSDICPVCNGSTVVFDGMLRQCRTCEGTGKRKTVTNSAG